MAMYPCSATGHMYRGSARHAYPALVRGRDSLRRHLRLCADHFRDLLDYGSRSLEAVDYEAPAPLDSTPPSCCECGTAPEDGRLIFITWYGEGEAQGSFYGVCCERCAPALALKLWVTDTTGRALP